jgi:hypothetical protein
MQAMMIAFLSIICVGARLWRGPKKAGRMMDATSFISPDKSFALAAGPHISAGPLNLCRR